MNWTQLLANIFKALPYVVAGVNVVHSEKDSQTKVQIAQDALAIATQGASAILTGTDAQAAQAVSGAVATAIQAVQAVHDATR